MLKWIALVQFGKFFWPNLNNFLYFSFLWYVNGRLVRDENVEFYFPKINRCVALFKLPETGHYTVVAQNEFGVAKSSGHVEVASHGKYLKSWYFNMFQ
jgi:hypothetical protein